MNRSVKLRITLWFMIVLLIIAALVLAAMYITTQRALIQNQKTHIEISVNEFSKKTTYKNGEIKVPAGAHYYERSVYRCIFDGEGTLLLGELPAQIKHMPISFSPDTIRQQQLHDEYYLEYDKKLDLGGKTYYAKGVSILTDEMQSLKSMLQNGILLIAVLVISASGCVYFLMCKAFAPVEKIRKAAKQIADGDDLSKRIRIGKGSDELHNLANSFDEMLDKLQQTMEREKQFSADASHELRTPIAVIRSECEYVQSCNCTKEECTEAIEAIARQAERMQSMVSGLLMISKIENSSLPLQPEETDISELLGFICDDQEEIHKTQIVMVRQIHQCISAKVDRDLFSRLCINLIENAYQYNKENGTITVTLEKHTDHYFLSVKDTGIGIPEEKLSKIWDRFYRADTARSTGPGYSVGLGLAMAKRIAKSHNGDLQVKSTPGEGSEFVFTFPV